VDDWAAGRVGGTVPAEEGAQTREILPLARDNGSGGRYTGVVSGEGSNTPISDIPDQDWGLLPVNHRV